jgi:maltose alpha-D-glucosyltransferase / alpha-amylase
MGMRRRYAIPPPRERRSEKNPLWYKDAVIYELRVRSFYDSNGDGIGDFRGLAAKLDYLQDLGVTAIWMLPFYPSPMRDDGYDIADYTDIQPECGSLADFEALLEESHRRGIRVITELVLNHTSDRHPWFKRARLAAPGSAERDFYVWSETPDRYRDARIIFQDFEASNWSWDAVAKAYFWHRFYAHQPDLNFENPAVHQALMDVVDFWLGKGVDGLRLDAVPYLYEAEGTNCENLPKTHQFLRTLRAHIDRNFEDRMLLAEANQWPEDAAAYFGAGDECHMNFHFPIMPRMFMAIHMEDRFPILDILAQTPQIPENCQWALFLRNHDELTLETVTDEERDYMLRAYANDAEMRINLGIRRRLAPLVGNDRRKMELLNGLLLSLPGTPVLYYGDEIGMGDNVFLGDRNGVRTPMQWSADRNAGFSRANPQRLILPITIDPEYHYEAVNVEAQQNNPNSLLWSTKHLIALRKQFQAFGRGSIEFLTPSNHRVLAFIRQFGDETILVVANLSRFVQYVELDLSKWKGTRPIELSGYTEFPAVGELPYLMTLGGHAFYWFALESSAAGSEAEAATGYRPPVLEAASLEALLGGEGRLGLEEALPAFLDTRRWFSGRALGLTSARIDALVACKGVRFLIARADYASAEAERFLIPLAAALDGRPVAPQSVLAIVRTGGGEVTLVDAGEDVGSARALLEMWIEPPPPAREVATRDAATIEATAFSPVEVPEAEPFNISAHHSSAALRYGDRYFLKLFRRIEEGVSPELEMSLFLNARAPGISPKVVGSLQLRRGRAEPSTLAVLQAFVPNEGTAWTHAREELHRFFERLVTRHRDLPPPESTPLNLLETARAEVPATLTEVIAAYLDVAALLGRRTADLHLALASQTADPAFAPEPYTPQDRRSKYQSMRNIAGKTLRLLKSNLARLPARIAPLAHVLAEDPGRTLKIFEPLLTQKQPVVRIRTHGDYHLDQILHAGKEFVILDFDGLEGETLVERRRKHSALRDVAGMIRSFHYAAMTALLDGSVVREQDREAATPWAEAWHRHISASFLRSYLAGTTGAPFIPTAEELPLVLQTHLIEKALQELRDELVACGETVTIPLAAIAELVGMG